MSGSLRLLCALLTLLLAFPAMQANACAPLAQGHAAHMTTAQDHDAHRGHHGQSPAQPASGSPRHDCMGCIPPIDVGVYRPVERLHIVFERRNNPVTAIAPTGRSAPPEPPPPRITV
jgi:hypothetical protein